MSVEDWCCAGEDSPGTHEEWCADDRIVITRRGIWELTLQGAPRIADATTATLWNRNTEYRVRHPLRAADRCTIFRLTEAGTRALRAARESHADRHAATFSRRSLPLDGAAYLLHRQVLRCAGEGTTDPIALEESAFELIRAVSGAADQAQAPESADRETVARVREVIVRDFAEPLSVEQIARTVGCSAFHLSRIFRRATGITLHRALMRIRLREGLERLLDEPQQISRIALDVGFASHSHFTDAFRAEYGCSPQQWRALGPARGTDS